MTQTTLFDLGGRWHRVKRCDSRARGIVDGDILGVAPHYSRQTPGARDFMGSGWNLVMITDDNRAVWGVILNRAPGTDVWRWRVSVFRNEGAGRSSDLIREATIRTYIGWRQKYKRTPEVPLTTEVDPTKILRKRDPGRCFLRAGWTRIGLSNGLGVLRAPPE